MFDWLRRLLSPMPEQRAPSAVQEHDWGSLRDQVEGDCRWIEWSAWSARVQSWEDLEPLLDQFLAASVDAITAGYPREPVSWMVLRFDPLRGQLDVVPAPERDGDEGDERVHLALKSSFLEKLAERTYRESADGSYASLYEPLWNMVRKHLRDGHTARKLAAARPAHALQVAAFNAPSGCDEEPVPVN